MLYWQCCEFDDIINIFRYQRMAPLHMGKQKKVLSPRHSWYEKTRDVQDSTDVYACRDTGCGLRITPTQWYLVALK